MAKIKKEKKKKVQQKEKVENEEVALPSTRQSDDVIPNKVREIFFEFTIWYTSGYECFTVEFLSDQM